MARVISITKHGNWHAMVKTYDNVTFVVKLLIAEKAFEETLGHGLGDNVESIWIYFKKEQQCWQKTFLCKTIFVEHEETE